MDLPLSMAGLPVNKAAVGVEPPLSCRESSNAFSGETSLPNLSLESQALLPLVMPTRL